MRKDIWVFGVMAFAPAALGTVMVRQLRPQQGVVYASPISGQKSLLPDYPRKLARPQDAQLHVQVCVGGGGLVCVYPLVAGELWGQPRLVYVDGLESYLASLELLKSIAVNAGTHLAVQKGIWVPTSVPLSPVADLLRQRAEWAKQLLKRQRRRGQVPSEKLRLEIRDIVEGYEALQWLQSESDAQLSEERIQELLEATVKTAYPAWASQVAGPASSAAGASIAGGIPPSSVRKTSKSAQSTVAP